MKKALIPLLLSLASALLVSAVAQADEVKPASPAASQAAAPLPADSVYQLPLNLTDQQGQRVTLDAWRGQPVLISMFYTSCEFVCPMLVDAMRDTLAKLSPEEQARMHVWLVSFDPGRDSVEVLKKMADARQLDAAHWRLARTDARSVRKLAAVLGIQFRALPSGDFNHTSALILLDAQGCIAAKSTQLGDADPRFVQQISRALASSK